MIHLKMENVLCSDSKAPTFSYLAKPPITAGSTIPFRSMESGLIGRFSSLWYWLIIIKIFSFVVDIVSIAFSKGLIVHCKETKDF